MVPDALSRLQAHADLPTTDKSDILDCLYGVTTPLSSTKQDALLLEVFAFHSTLIAMTDDFKKRLMQAYIDDE